MNSHEALDGAEENTTLSQAIDLTDEVVISNHRPDFIGTYSYIYKGLYRDEMASAVILRLPC
jgi:hypothetical protein